MILRRTQSHIVAITQPAHAWLAGRLAEVWGNGRFEVPQPRDEVVCATHLHDIGWLEWEQAPRLNAKNGYPLEFQDVPAEEHTRFWARGVEQVSAYGDFVSLLVSRHGEAIYEKTFDHTRARPSASEAVRAFSSLQHEVQSNIISRLASTPENEWIGAAHLQIIKNFIVAIDTMSLHLCWGIKEPIWIRDVPVRDGRTESIHLRPADARSVSAEPWPFARERISLRIPCRQIESPSKNQEDLDVCLRSALPVHFDVELIPA